jgi:hypothetical protein
MSKKNWNPRLLVVLSGSIWLGVIRVKSAGQLPVRVRHRTIRPRQLGSRAAPRVPVSSTESGVTGSVLGRIELADLP